MEELYDDRVVFQFYSKSKDSKAGEGAGERNQENVDFSELNAIENWRQKLSNFAISPFYCDGKMWSSVEHYYHANKFKLSNNTNGFYEQFSLDSGTALSKDPIRAKSYGGKTGKYKGKIVRNKEIIIDPGFFENDNRDQVMERGMYSKFTQNLEFKRILILTKKSKLVHFTRGGNEVFYDLMRVRDRIIKENI